jgi:hypothetical protein
MNLSNPFAGGTVSVVRPGKSGSLHVIVDGFYTGPIIVDTKNGPKNRYYLLLLLSRITKTDRKIINRWRKVPILTYRESTEFNIVMKALYGSAMITLPPNFVDFEKVTSVIIDDIRNNNINARIQWVLLPDKKVSVIGSMCMLNDPLEFKRRGMLWTDSATYRFNGLYSRNDALNAYYDSLEEGDDRDGLQTALGEGV